MNPSDPNVRLVEVVAQALGELCDELVLVGGCAAGLLYTSPNAPPPRVTFDVDVVAEVAALAAYHALEKRFASRGFARDMSPDAPICRWRLGEVQVYAVLSPLEALFERGRTAVRAAVLKAARHLYFKRTFVVINKGVQDPEQPVRRTAQDAIAALHFPHAFDPLSRLHRESADPDIRRAALQSIGRIQSLEAVEYLIGVVLHGSQDERVIARDLLLRSDYSETSKALALAIEHETGDVQRLLQQIRYQRGER